VAGSLALAGCSASASGTSSNTGSGKTLTVGIATAVATFSQSQLQGGSDELFWRAVYTTLLTRNTKGDLEPDGATSWSYNAAKTVLTVKLRPGMKFTDGSPVNAQAAVTSLENMKNGGGPNQAYLANVKTITATDNLTVKIVLAKPDPGLTYYLSMDAGAIANPKYIKAKDAATNPQGSGPYSLDKSRTTIGAQYTFVRNKSYWDPKAYPYDTVVVKILPDVTSRLNALRSGQINAAQLDGSTAAAAKGAGLNVFTQELTVMSLEIRDTQGKTVPALASQKVRQAMNLAFDRPAIVKNLLHGYGQPTDQFFIKGSQSYLPSEEKHYPYDVAKAKKLMAEAGYPNGFDLTLPTETPIAFLNPTVQQSLGAIGIRVHYKTVADTQWTTKMISGAYPMYLQDASSRTAWIDLGLWIAPGATWNSFHLGASADRQLTSLITQAQYAKTDAVANKVYQEIGRKVLDLAWFVPLYRDEIVNVTDKNTSGSSTPGVAIPLIQNYKPEK
jgi:peptide/nickel transport system substrate-binding protein